MIGLPQPNRPQRHSPELPPPPQATEPSSPKMEITHPAQVGADESSLAPPDAIRDQPPPHNRHSPILPKAVLNPAPTEPIVHHIGALSVAPIDTENQPEVSPEPSPRESPIHPAIAEEVHAFIHPNFLDQNTWMDPAAVATYLEHGPETNKDAMLAQLETEATTAAQLYNEELESFVGTSAVEGIPVRFDSRGSAILPNIQAATTKAYGQWLDLVAEYLPDTSHEMLAEAVQTMRDAFDPEEFVQAIAEYAPDKEYGAYIREKIEQRCAHVIDTIAEKLRAHSDDPDLLRSFQELKFVSTYGLTESKDKVTRQIIDLEGFDADNPQHAELAARVIKDLREPSIDTSPGMTALTIALTDELPWALRWMPQQAIDALTHDEQQHGEHFDRVALTYLRTLDPNIATDDHRAALEVFEERIKADNTRYTAILEVELQETGTISPASLQTLHASVRAGGPVCRRAIELLSAFLPFDELTDHLYPGSTFLIQLIPRSIVVRRLAAEGDLAQATRIARNSRDPASTALDLLAIYDETNNPLVLAQAKEFMESEKYDLSTRSTWKGMDIYLFVLAQHISAHKYGNTEQITETTRHIDAILNKPGYHLDTIREGQYEWLVQAHLDTGNLALAETTALQGIERINQSNDSEAQVKILNTLIQLTHSYIQHGRHQDAARIVREHLLQPNIPTTVAYSALAALNGKRPGRQYSLYSPMINALHEARRSRRS